MFVNGEEIVCTGGHPFYVVGLDKFLPVRELKLYEKVLLSDGSCGTIDSIGIEALLKPETTYNFEVADYHTYYVGENSVCVHNANCGKSLYEKVADEMGYKKVKGQYSHGASIYTNSKAPKAMRYISPDIDMHNGGFWKAASSVKNLFSKNTRTGTFDMYLNRRIGP